MQVKRKKIKIHQKMNMMGKNIVKGVTQVNEHSLKLHFCMFKRS